ncbi:hypothetical protein L1785_02640 [Antribacter sp. KLBMP9083]|uniref:Uncharacterized protein n=1 Tax=Antribacter soli TaxID=2910976 RepID=A0AA41U7X7_9MICO|nr:hypothetical protein [Antribacter soli]MCF4119867.1 hypothetical protein [Antribacter soli]
MSIDTVPADLLAQIRDALSRIHPRTYPVALRVRYAGTGPTLASCELWTGDADLLWARRATIDVTAGATMPDVEQAVLATGYCYALTRDGRPAWRFDANHGGIYALDITLNDAGPHPLAP